MKQTWWQILPLGPTGAGDSPYQSFSAFAGSIKLLSPELLERDGLVSSSFWAGQAVPGRPRRLRARQRRSRRRCSARRGTTSWPAKAPSSARASSSTIAKREAAWLDDYALFTAIRDSLGGRALPDWPTDLLAPRTRPLWRRPRRNWRDAIGCTSSGSSSSTGSGSRCKQFANERGVKIIGDAPIFVALDSADVWAHPDQFLLDADRKPTVVAGVPPDYFSADGQHWGNPIYDWPRMEQTGFAWWVRADAAPVEARSI